MKRDGCEELKLATVKRYPRSCTALRIRYKDASLEPDANASMNNNMATLGDQNEGHLSLMFLGYCWFP